MKNTVTVTMLSEYGNEEWPVLEFLRMVEKAISDIPTEYRQKAKAELDGGYDESISLVIRYSRPETEEEELKRKALSQRYKQEQEERDRQTYESLKRKFGK
jgi:DNA-binding SARP family transcriptional activator